MKRYGNLYCKILNEDALWDGYLEAKKSKASKRSCLEFEKSLGKELKTLLHELETRTYKPLPYKVFRVHEPKERVIYAPEFRDCVVQHAIYKVVMPIFERSFIDQSFACRKGKGTHKASDFCQQSLRKCPSDSYYLQLDIRKFFYSIDRDILKTQLERKVKDKEMVDIMMMFTTHGEDKGIPIGNLLSQMFALVYLNPLDHFIKRVVAPKKLYCRYVDDFIIFGISLEEAKEYKETIERYLITELGLSLSKSHKSKISKGINFCGYRTWSRARFVRKHSLYKFRKAVKHGKVDSVQSHLAHASKTHSLQHMLTHIKEKNFELYCKIPETYQSRHYQAA